jgi:hypothetical protein
MRTIQQMSITLPNGQLAELYRWMEDNATVPLALSYTSSVVEYAKGAATGPLRETRE